MKWLMKREQTGVSRYLTETHPGGIVESGYSRTGSATPIYWPGSIRCEAGIMKLISPFFSEVATIREPERVSLH